MKTLRKIRKNAKALSPVVASIILIAVTVAVSIAVAAWMGALTVGFMGTEQLEIRSVSFSGTGNTVITVVARNTGTSAVTIQEVWLNNVDESDITTVSTEALPQSVDANDDVTLTITLTSLTTPTAWVAGNNYQVKLVTAKGNPFMRNAIPPT